MIGFEQGVKIFKAIGDPKRAMIIDMISQGELCACMILEKFRFSQSTLSHHMKLLCDCGIVDSREQGKWTYYSLNQSGVREALQFLSRITTAKEGPPMINQTKTCCRDQDGDGG